MTIKHNIQPFIIADIGINHNGDMDIVRQLMKIAKECGCDAVKFQKRDVDLIYTQEFLDSPLESPWGTTQRDHKERRELGQAQYEEINAYSKELGIEWFASAWDVNSLDFLDQFGCKYSKVASAMLLDHAFLKRVAEKSKYTFVSTAMSTMEDIDEAVRIFKEVGCPFELMHCVGIYPLDHTDANLRCIETLRERFQCKVGYSGHEPGLAVSYGAVAMGATSIERHITLDRAMYGADQAASLEPAGLRMMVGTIRKMVEAMGDGVKRFLPQEVKSAARLRYHIKG